MAALEDKIVLRATVAVLNCICEEEFLGFSYGFRPKRPLIAQEYAGRSAKPLSGPWISDRGLCRFSFLFF